MFQPVRSEGPVYEPLENRALLSASPISDMSSAAVLAAPAAGQDDVSIVGQLSSVTPVTTSTIPSNGDVNPYGVAFVPTKFRKGGSLKAGDLLVSNFNASSGLQGTGTTIVSVTPDGTTSTFFQGSAGLGLTTALGTLSKGFVIVGNMPTTDGTSATVQSGSLLVIDRSGNLVSTITDPMIDGPWDMTIRDRGGSAQMFVSNVLSGTVVRIDVKVGKKGVTVKHITQIGSGFTHQSDPSALELGPTGLVLDHKTGKLFVASTADNEIFAISKATRTHTDNGTGTLIINDPTHLHGPLGMTQSTNGDLIIANGDAINADPSQPSEIVEFTRTGTFVSQFSLDSNPDAPFGITLTKKGRHAFFAAVNDNVNTVSIWDLAVDRK